LRLRHYRISGSDIGRLGWHNARTALAVSDHYQATNRDNEHRRGGA
jgi:hypothetical protein